MCWMELLMPPPTEEATVQRCSCDWNSDFFLSTVQQTRTQTEPTHPEDDHCTHAYPHTWHVARGMWRPTRENFGVTSVRSFHERAAAASSASAGRRGEFRPTQHREIKQASERARERASKQHNTTQQHNQQRLLDFWTFGLLDFWTFHFSLWRSGPPL